MDNQKIGNFIANIRKEKNLTQKDLADKLNITNQAISKWERGKGCPDISLLDNLSKILDVSILEILKGRRLDKDERLENKDLIETMTFTEDNFKNKIKKLSNIVAISIFVFIILLIAFFNIKSYYHMNKTYKNNNDKEINLSIFNNIDNKVDLILNNKGNYIDEEYDIILNYVKAIKDLTNTNNTKKIIKKESFTYKELTEFYNDISLYEIIGYDFDLNSKVYKVLVNYDINKLDNMLKFNKLMNFCIEILNNNNLYQLHHNNVSIDKNVVDNIFNFIQIQYTSYNLILDDIIEVGEIHE